MRDPNYLVIESLKNVVQMNRVAIKIPTIVANIMMKYHSIKELVKGTHNDTQQGIHPEQRTPKNPSNKLWSDAADQYTRIIMSVLYHSV